MRSLLVLVSVIVFAYALDKASKDEMKKKIQEYGGKCILEENATEADISDLLSQTIPPTGHGGKCVIFCLHKKLNMMTEDGKINKEGTMETINLVKEQDPDLHEKFVKIFDKCNESTEIDADPCITSSNWAACGIKEAETMGVTEKLFSK